MMSFEGVMMGKLVITIMLLFDGDILVQGGEKMHFTNAVVLIKPNEPLPRTATDIIISTPLAPQPNYSRVEKHCFANRKVFYRGSCWDLLKRGPCQDGHWLVLDPAYEGVKPVCQRRLCPSDMAFWEPTGECISLRDKNKCTKKETSLQVDTLGFGACKCMNGIARAMAPNGACYKLYTRGFCDEGYIVVNNPEADQYPATCVPDPCAAARKNSTDPNEIILPYKDSCYPVESPEPCPEDEVLVVDVKTRLPTCKMGINTWSSIYVPPKCHLVDHDNRCQEKLKLFTNEINGDKKRYTSNFGKG